MKSLLKDILRKAGYELRPITRPQSLKERYPDVTEREWKIYSAVEPFTMMSLERILANIRAIDYVVANQIAGDIVECGVWRGGSSMAMALALDGQARALWLYDTFAGMTDATDVDLSSSGEKASALLESAKKYEVPERSLVLAFASLEDVTRNIESTAYPTRLVRFIQGPVEQTIPDTIPERIALLRIDTDWYESTRHELVHLYPRLSPGGVLIIDDYGHWQGARKAVDEYFQAGLFLNRIDYTGRLAIKPLR
jgi:O-methyltransferase